MMSPTKETGAMTSNAANEGKNEAMHAQMEKDAGGDHLGGS